MPVVALLVWLVLTHYVFLIRNVTVVGAGDMAEADVVRLSGIPLGGRLNAVDKAALRTRLESTGRLAFVSAERKYPDTIVLTVRQRSRDALILQGGKDFQVDKEKDFGLYKTLLQGRENVTFRLYDDLNHCFVPAIFTDITKAKKEYSTERHIGSGVIRDIAEWIMQIK